MNKFQLYIIREVLKPLIAIAGILAALFASFSGARYLAQAVTETLGSTLILKLVFLKTLIAMEVLFPIALYAAIIVALGRLYRDQEIIVMHSVGVGESYIIKTIFMIAFPLAIMVGLHSVYIRPWAYEAAYLIDAGTTTELNLDRYQSGRFYGNGGSGRVIYINNRTEEGEKIHQMFHYIRGDSSDDIIIAKEAYQDQPDPYRPPQLHLLDGSMYRLEHSDTNDTVVRFDKFVYLPEFDNTTNYRRKAASTSALLESDKPQDIAELQWRLSRPFATLLLALVSMPLSRSSPRQGKSEKILSAAIIFALYYNLSGLAQTWVELGVMGKFPGVWWLHALMFFVVVYLMLPKTPKRARQR
jgi:lipopolysaccharide export system permease protein